jgi:hypothetical protein
VPVRTRNKTTDTRERLFGTSHLIHSIPHTRTDANDHEAMSGLTLEFDGSSNGRRGDSSEGVSYARRPYALKLELRFRRSNISALCRASSLTCVNTK